MGEDGKIPEGGFDTEVHLEYWMQNQNRFDLVIIAARAVLRIIPALSIAGEKKPGGEYELTSILLPFFRTIGATFVMGGWSNRVATITLINAVADVTSTSLKSAKTTNARTIIRAAGHAVAISNPAIKAAEPACIIVTSTGHAVRTFAHSITHDAIRVDPSHVDHSMLPDTDKFVFREMASDAVFIQNAGTAQQLAQLPLWHEADPESFKKSWQLLKKDLLALDEGWQVWTDWYEARLRGDLLNKELEIARVTELTEEDWDKGAKHVNAKIKAIIERFEKDEIKLPPQDPTAETFGLDDQGKITVTTPTEGMHLEDTPEQQNWYEELRVAVQELAAKSDNQLGAVAGPITSLQEALPEKIAYAIIARVWSRANRLRVLLKRHDEALKNPDYAHEKLDPSIASDVEHVIGLFSNLALGDAGLRNAEEGARGPQSESEIEGASKLAVPIIEDAIATGITDDLATEVLQEALSNFEGELQYQNDIMGRSIPERLQAVQSYKIFGNLVAGLLAAGRKVRDGGLWAVGAGTVKFISEHKGALLEFAKQAWPNFVSAIENLLGLLN